MGPHFYAPQPAPFRRGKEAAAAVSADGQFICLLQQHKSLLLSASELIF